VKERHFGAGGRNYLVLELTTSNQRDEVKTTGSVEVYLPDETKKEET